MSTMLLVLIITLIGMGLVFLTIILLWGLMAALVRLLPESVEPQETQPGSEEIDEARNRQAAAAAAVAIGLQQQSAPGTEPQEFPLPETPLVSAWQAVLRSNMLNKRGFQR